MEMIANNPKGKPVTRPSSEKTQKTMRKPSGSLSRCGSSQLMYAAEEIRRDLLEADSDRTRTFLYAIRFREMLNKARRQFEREEASDSFLQLLDNARTNRRASELIGQHISLLQMIEDMLEQAELRVRQMNGGEDMLLLNRFWNFCKQLRAHELAEQKLFAIA